MINRRSLFSDETKDYKTPYEPDPGDRVTLTVRTLTNDVFAVYAMVNGVKREMKKSETRGRFDFYTCSFVCPRKQVKYFFVFCDDDERIFYNRLGPRDAHERRGDFSFVPGFKVPEWARGAVYYQIFTDRFKNGEPRNDVADNEYYYTGGHSRHVADWDKPPETLDVRFFYGGDLQGVREELDYLQNLGVEAIYFNPLFVSPSNHKYDTQDYGHIDPHFAVIEDDLDHEMQHWEHHNGYAPKYIRRVTTANNLQKSNEYFSDLVKEIHARGMKVVIDGVFNHCGSFNKWMDREGIYLNKEGYEKGAYQSVKSPYRKYFKFKTNRVADSEYEGWWDIPTLPKLNYEESPELEEYILGIGEEWVSEPYCVDGWRLDVAADLGHSQRYNHEFWKKFRKRVKKANPEAFVFAEHYGSAVPWFDGAEWDSTMNYDAFMDPVSYFLTGMEKHSDSFDSAKYMDGEQFFAGMEEAMVAFPRPSLDSALNQLSNHDHSRFLTRTNRTVGRLETKGFDAASENVDPDIMKLAVLIQMTWPGSPGVYYGDEAGQVGWTDPDNRRTYPWGHETGELVSFHRDAIALRKKIECLKAGSVKSLIGGGGYIAYARFDSEDCAIVAINCSSDDIALNIPVWEAGLPSECSVKKVFSTKKDFEETDEKVSRGWLYASIPAKSGAVYRYEFKTK